MSKLILENHQIQVTVLPEFGGKISSIYYKEKNFECVAVNRSGVYEKSNRTTAFSDRDASGIDDVFPSFEEEKVYYEGRESQYTDHGEIWRSCFEVVKVTLSEVELFYSSDENAYDYTKIIRLLKSGVSIKYHIVNKAESPLPCIWGFHGLFRYESDMRFFYPKGIKKFTNVFQSEELGSVGSTYSLDNEQYDFKGVGSIFQKSAVKYYAEEEVQEGRCGYYYPSHGVACELQYDYEVLPYLGVWITAGGYRNDYNCALEPTNGFYDTVLRAINNKKVYYLVKDTPLEFELQIQCNLVEQ